MVWKLDEEILQAELAQNIRHKYGLVFEPAAGRDVLADILRDLGVCGDLDPRDQVSNGLRNYAETVLRAKVGKRRYLAAVGVLLPDDE